MTILIIIRKIKTLNKILFNHIILTLNGIWAIPIVLLTRLIYPFIKIKYCKIWAKRIGHFTSHTILSYNQSILDKSINFYWIQGPICNVFWEEVVRRNLKISQLVKYLEIWNKILPGGENLCGLDPFVDVYDKNLNLVNKKNVFLFTELENKYGYNWLIKNGWKKNMPVVCLIVRDNAYLSKDKIHTNIDYSYHSYRNSKISNFLSAVEWLSDQGAFVIRMGKIVESPLNTKKNNIVDYPYNIDKSDFLDCWLMANCQLCISTGTGLDTLAHVYQIPTLYINLLPLSSFKSTYFFSDSMIVPKKLFSSKFKQYLTVFELLKSDFNSTYEYDLNNLEIQESSESEIFDAVVEFWNVKYLNLREKNFDALQLKFWNIVYKYLKQNNTEMSFHPKTLVSSNWLKKVNLE